MRRIVLIVVLSSLLTSSLPVVTSAQSSSDMSLSQLASLISSLQSIVNSLKSKVAALKGTSSISIAQAQTADITTGLVGHWKFDEGAGTSASDSSGNNNTGTLTNGPTWMAGKISNALNFDGSNDYIDLPNNAFDSLTQGTVAAWVRWSGGAPSGAIFDGGGGCFAGSAGQFELYLSSSGNLGLWAVNENVGCGETLDVTVPISNPTNWHHIVFTNTTSGHAFYVDGIKQNPVYSRGNASTDFFFDNLSNSPDYRIGTVANNNNDEPFSGLIDDVRIYNRALSASDISTLYNYTGGPPDSIAPSASLTAPASGSTVSGTITISANASDPSSPSGQVTSGVAGVQFKLDGSNLGGEDTTSPYSITWNTTTASNGSHTLTATVRDAAGNTTTSSGVTVTVSNTAPPPDTQAPTTPTNLSATAQSSSQINLSWTASTDNVGVTGYRVERCTGSTCTTFSQISTPSSTTYNDTGLAANTTYRYQVRATDAANNLSSYSNITNGTTLSAPTSGSGAPMSGPLGTRTTPYIESICNTNSNVFFCEDFEDAATWPQQGTYGDCNQSGTWRNPAFQQGDNCYNNGTVVTSTITNPANPGGSRVMQFPIIGNAAASTVGGWLRWQGQGTAVSDYYVRYQFYYSSDMNWPNDLDIKQLFTQPEVFVDNPSADYQNGTMFHQDMFCSGVGNFNDVMVLRRSGAAPEGGYPYPFSPLPGTNAYCPPSSPGVAANGINAPRIQKNRWYTVEMHFTLGSSNGTAEMWLDGNLAYRFANVRTCDVCNPMAYFFLTGYKGWGESGGGSVQYDNLVMSTSYIGPPSGGTTPPDTTSPSAPPNLSASAVSSSQINLTWTASTDNVGVTGYRVERCQGSSCTNFTQIATPSGTAHNDTGLSANTTYRYQVRATDIAGNISGYSSMVSAVTQPTTSTKFVINDRVQVSSGPLNVRSTPSISGILLGTQSTGSLGAVISGPTFADGYWWWNINFDSGADGWSVEDFLERNAAPPTGSGGAPLRSGQPYAEATKCADSNVILCEDFDYPQNFMCGGPIGGGGLAYNWANPGLKTSHGGANCSSKSFVSVSTVPAMPTGSPTAGYVKRVDPGQGGDGGDGGCLWGDCDRTTADNPVGATYTNGTPLSNDLYFRFQMYLSSDYVFPSFDNKIFFFWPNAYIDKPSANIDAGFAFIGAYCTNVSSSYLKDALSFRVGSNSGNFKVYPADVNTDGYPEHQEYCLGQGYGNSSPPVSGTNPPNDTPYPGTVFRFQKSKWYNIEFRYKLSSPDQSNGTIEAWINGTKVYSDNDLETCGSGMGSCASIDEIVQYFWYNYYQEQYTPGGYALVDNLIISKAYIGPPSGGTPPTTLVGDLNLDRIVNSLDWSLMNAAWATNNATADLNRDGIVNSLDFSLLNSNWGRTI